MQAFGKLAKSLRFSLPFWALLGPRFPAVPEKGFQSLLVACLFWALYFRGMQFYCIEIFVIHDNEAVQSSSFHTCTLHVLRALQPFLGSSCDAYVRPAQGFSVRPAQGSNERRNWLARAAYRHLQRTRRTRFLFHNRRETPSDLQLLLFASFVPSLPSKRVGTS